MDTIKASIGKLRPDRRKAGGYSQVTGVPDFLLEQIPSFSHKLRCHIFLFSIS